MAGGTDNDNEVLTDAGDFPTGAPAQTAEKPLVVNIADAAHIAPAPAQPEQPAQTEQPPSPPLADPDDVNTHLNNLMAVNQDAAAGQITPQTYQSMYEKKDTLGKIGTLFGLLVSGAGSGLAHQPNMVMDMMNKTIDRDFEAQKENVHNGRNFLALQFAHDQQLQHLRDAQLKGLPQAQQTADFLGDPSIYENYKKQSSALMSQGAAKANALIFGAQHIKDIASRTNNPQAIAAANAVGQAALPAAQKAIVDADAKRQALKQQAIKDASPIDEDALQRGFERGQFAKAAGLVPKSGVINPDHYAQIQQEKALLDKNRKAAALINDSFNQISNMKFAGEVPGAGVAAKGLSALAGVLPGNLSHAAGAVGDETKKAFERQRTVQVTALKGLGFDTDEIENMVPSWNDRSPQALAEVRRKAMDKLKAREVTPIIDTYNAQIPGFKREYPSFQRPKGKR